MQKYDTKQLLVRSGIFKIITFVSLALSSLITLPILLNLLGNYWYGVWVVIAAFMSYFGLLDIGLTSATNRFMSYHWDDSDQTKLANIFKTSLLTFSGISVFACVLSIIGIYLSPIFIEDSINSSTIKTVLIIFTLDLITLFPSLIFQTIYSIRLRHDVISVIELTNIILRVCLIIVIASYNGTIVDIALISLGLNLIKRIFVVIYSFRLLPKGLFKSGNYSYMELKRLIQFGKYTFVSKLNDTLRYRVDIVLIGILMSSPFVALYNIALQLNNVISMPVKAIVSNSEPIFTRYYSDGKLDQIQEKLLLLSRISVYLSVMAVFSGVIISHSFIIIWVGESMIDAVMPFYVLAALLPFGAGQAVLPQVLNSTNNNKYLAQINMLEAVFNIPLTIMLIQYYGILGAAIGTAIPFIIGRVFFLQPIACRMIKLRVSVYRKNYFSTFIKAISLEAPLAIAIYFLEITGFYEIISITLIWQFVAGYVLLKYVISNDDYRFIERTSSIINKIVRR